MYFKQFYLGCLAHASYLIGSEGEAAVVDPQRDVEQYIDEAAQHGLTIRYVIETHLHADFVSGHRELAARTGADIVFGARANAEFPHLAVREGDELRIGRVRLKVLETPGHTPESVSLLVIDEEEGDAPTRVLTGDALFIGDVGRPDLAGAKGFTAEQMASMLYDSLHEKLLKLDDSVGVYPAHGAGSACGRNISSERSSTLGEQRRFNYALRPMPREEFVRMMTTDLAEPPKYFPIDAEINRRGAGPLHLSIPPLTAHEADVAVQKGAAVLDVRDGAAFGAGHLPGAINVGLDGQYASWAGSLLSPDEAVVIVADGLPQVEEAVMRLARVGLENLAGYLDGGVAAWATAGLEIETLQQLPVDELHERMREGILRIIDVRTPAEYASGHIPGAVNAPLAELPAAAATLAPDVPSAVICAAGYRSAAASSLLARSGFREIYNVVGGTTAWVGAGFETETVPPA